MKMSSSNQQGCERRQSMTKFVIEWNASILNPLFRPTFLCWTESVGRNKCPILSIVMRCTDATIEIQIHYAKVLTSTFELDFRSLLSFKTTSKI